MAINLRATLTTFVRQPLLHFLFIGVAIGLLYSWSGQRDADPADQTIRITAAEINLMTAQWQARWNRPPMPAELDGLIKTKIREDALYREALAIGLDDNDPVIRRVLVQRLEGMARDLVEFSLSPTDQDLQAYFAKHAEHYRPPALISFTHVFVDPDRRDDRTLEDAAKMLAELQSLDNPMEDAERFGDPFMLQRYYPEKPEQRIASLFGREFARALFDLPEGRWHGPVLSGYGTHLVYVDEIREAPVPTLLEVKDRVTQDWVDEKRTEITEKYFAEILARYDVIIEREPAVGSAATASVQAP